MEVRRQGKFENKLDGTITAKILTNKEYKDDIEKNEWSLKKTLRLSKML
jgi:hypothetical protein